MWEQFYFPLSHVVWPLNLYLFLLPITLFSSCFIWLFSYDCRWQVMPTKSKSKLMEKKRNLWVGYNKFEVIMKHSGHFSPSVLFSDFRITSSPGRPAGYVVPNCQTYTGLSLKTLSLYFGKNCLLVLVDLWCYFLMLGIMWSKCIVQQCNCKSFFFCPFQKETFEGLSQEALSLCIQSLKTASALITQRKVWNYLDLYLVYFVLCFSQAHRIYLISLIRYCPVRACLS